MPSYITTVTSGGNTKKEVIFFSTSLRAGGATATLRYSTTTVVGNLGIGDPSSPTTSTGSSTVTPLSGSGNSASSSTIPPSTVSSNAPSSSTSVPAASAGGSTQQSSNNGFSSGDLAGAAVGCLIGGALIAFLIAFLIFRKRDQRNSSSRSYPPSDDSSNQRDVIAMTEKPTSKSPGGVMGWQAFLPQSADDRTIQNSVKTLFNLIELHVDNFYHKAPVELDQRAREALARIDSGKLPGQIDQLMQDQRLVLPVIKHCIADLLITRMSPLTYPDTSLLPANLSAFPTKLQSSSLPSSERTASQQAYSQWRLLNAYLYPHPQEDTAYIDDREAKASEISDRFYQAFAPWQMAEGEKNEMRQHEKGLVATAGNLGILLMSQPSAFEFKWSADSGRNASSRSLIALPGFWKTTDEQGRPLGQPQLLVSPLMLRV